MKDSLIACLFFVIFILVSDKLTLAKQPVKQTKTGLNYSECKTCTESADGAVHCRYFKCPTDLYDGFEKYELSPQGKEIITILSEFKKSEVLIDTIHENKNILKAISLFLQIPDIQDLKEEKFRMLFGYLGVKAGWKGWLPTLTIKHVNENLYLVGIGYAATTQPSSLYIFYDSSYKRIAKGENGMISVIDFRLRDDELGVVFYREYGSHPPKDFALLKRENGEWFVKWTPEGQKEWIPADEEITFLKDDLSLIRVKGSDFGLYSVEQTVRDKISEDIDRQDIGRHFTGIWERKGDAYVRRSKLPLDAPLYNRLREMADQGGPDYRIILPGAGNQDYPNERGETLKK